MTGAANDPAVCCVDCPLIDGLWARMQLARSILHHRAPAAETVTLALRALDGESLELLSGESSAVADPPEVS